MEYNFLKRGGRSVDPAYLVELIDKGRINIVQAKTLTMIYDMLKERVTIPWDIQLVWQKDYVVHNNEYGNCANADTRHFIPLKLSFHNANIVLLYEEIEIKNSKGVKHTIRDLYVSIPVTFSTTSNTVFISTPEGRRGRTTLAEFKKGYRHSHLGSRPMNGGDHYVDSSSFCLGTGEISNTIGILSGDMDLEMLELLIHQLDVYVRWESLEGIPFIGISNLIGADYNLPQLADETAKNIVDTAIVSKWSDYNMLKWKYNNKTERYEIMDTECVENFLMNLRDRGMIRLEHFFFKDHAGNLFMEDMLTSDALEQKVLDQEYFFFKNQRVNLVVEGKPLKATENRTLYPHQKLVAYAKQFLEYRANSSKIRESRIKEFR